MGDDTLIADLIRAGLAPELVGRVSAAIAEAMALSAAINVPDMSRTLVRGYEAERKRVQRQNRKQNSSLPKANDVGNAAVSGDEMSRTVPDNRTNTFFLSSSESIREERKKKKESARARGTRITADWQPSEADRQFAIDNGIRDVEALRAEFIDYWIGVPGQRGLKTDVRGWSATWRNRVRQVGNGKSGNRRTAATPGSPATGADAILAGMGRVAERRFGREFTGRPDDGKFSGHADAAGGNGVDRGAGPGDRKPHRQLALLASPDAGGKPGSGGGNAVAGHEDAAGPAKPAH